VCDLETSRIGCPYIYDISTLRVKTFKETLYCDMDRLINVGLPSVDT